MRLLYIFPHPDDESYGVAHVISKERREGHEVFLLTLTRGGATKRRHDFGLTIEEMGRRRLEEMEAVARVLDLTDLTVLDFPDSELAEMDPRELEAAIANHIELVKPQVIVTYPVHGISGFHDHLVTHAVVKRSFVVARESASGPRRLAFQTLTEDHAATSPHFRLAHSKPELIDCIVHVDPEDIDKAKRALDCYTTFQRTIEESGIKDMLRKEVAFELFGEERSPPLADLVAELPRG
ncbi:MAG TPA: PIG-L family deacetylase [Planctomycetota bacterium]|nr:PIG-L family deacetylase [Planctomycetota bacterium]